MLPGHEDKSSHEESLHRGPHDSGQLAFGFFQEIRFGKVRISKFHRRREKVCQALGRLELI